MHGYMSKSASNAVEVTTNHRQTPSPLGPKPQMAMECTKVIAVEPLQDHGYNPTTMGFEQLLDLECTPPTAGPGESKEEALSEQVIEGAFLFLEEAAKEAKLSRNKDTLPMTNKITHKNWETPKDTVTTDKLYNHHKVLIFTCYRLNKYVDLIARTNSENKTL